VSLGGNVSAEGYVVPLEEADVAFAVGGRVTELLVAEGEQVVAGQTLIRLDEADTVAAVSVAEVILAQAQANLAQVKAGATAEQIAAAEAAVTQAEANLAQVLAGATPEEIAVARAKVNTLQAQLAEVLAGTRLEALEAALVTVRQAENALKLAQTEYDKVAYAIDSDQAQPVALALEDATLSYEAALANYQALADGATPKEIAVVRARVAEGQATLDQLLAGASPEQIAVAQTGVLEAEAGLAQVSAGATAEQIAVAEVGVRRAEAELARTQLALDDLQISAPFAGTVANLEVNVGEMVEPGKPVVNVADLSTWQIETDDLTELEVVDVAPGQRVNIRFDAFPGEEFRGIVSLIKPRSELKAGDVTYTVVIDFTEGDTAQLRWGMTAVVEILVEAL
jgi:HlyD family secretion protein